MTSRGDQVILRERRHGLASDNKTRDCLVLNSFFYRYVCGAHVLLARLMRCSCIASPRSATCSGRTGRYLLPLLLTASAVLPAFAQSAVSRSPEHQAEEEQEGQAGLPIWLLYLAAQRAEEQKGLKAEIAASVAYVAGAPITFDASSSLSAGGELTYEWTLETPDGSYTVLTDRYGQQVVLEPDMAGLYTLTLTVTNPRGLRSTDSISFTPDLPAPEMLPDFMPATPPTPFLTDQTDAIRLLYQATFGPRVEEVEHLMDVGAEEWFQSQLTMEPSGYVEAWASIAEAFGDENEDDPRIRIHPQAFMQNALYSPDQLRQRMTFALSQLLVVSEKFDFAGHDQLVLGYADVLHDNAFGNYRDLLKAVALHPAMGLYLAMLGNEKADPARNIRPDENFARELMQLFTIGLQELNQDGTPLLESDGEVIQTYGPVDVQNYAAALTGWYFGDLSPGRFGDHFFSIDLADRLRPMTAYADYHQTTQKKLLRGYYVPAGATAEQSLDAVLDSLFYHPNLAPFVSRHLIKSFVTSNPSPEYVGRVSAVFNQDEFGERGNLGSVIQAVLFDPEARLAAQEQPATYGRAKSPLLRYVNYARFFNVQSYEEDGVAHLRSSYSQDFLRAPSVFNFFSPAHVPNSDFADLDLVAPEFQIITSETLVRDSGQYAYMNSLEYLELCCSDQSDESKIGWRHYDPGELPALLEFSGTAEVITYLDTYLTQGRLSESSKAALLQAFDDTFSSALAADNRQWMLGTLRDLIYQIVSSPEYFIQR